MTDKLLSPEVQNFIKDHQSDDPFLLSLNVKKEDDFPLKEAVEQIQSLQKAKGKLPSWTKTENILWPPPVSVEQSSSEITARFKASIIHGSSMADLTGGMGADTSFFADHFESIYYVESDPHLCELARHNFSLLGKSHIHAHNTTAEEFLINHQENFDAIFIDPSRRFENRKVFKINECSPNLYDILPKCKAQTDQILIKLSPLVDLSFLINEFYPLSIWVVAVKNEVKEVLCLIRNENRPTRIVAIDLSHNGKINSEFKFLYHKESESNSEFSHPQKYLYEPNASILKAGAFKLIGNHFGLKKLHQHSHLYTSDELVENFPGKTLVVSEQLRLDKKEVRHAFPEGIVNVITRNFPLSPAQLKAKFGLKNGGDHFLIGTTLMDGKKELLACHRLAFS
jgi:hypothetical protein